jgi:hypothetical protein
MIPFAERTDQASHQPLRERLSGVGGLTAALARGGVAR